MVRDREKFNHGAITFTTATGLLSVSTLEALPRDGHNLVTPTPGQEPPPGRDRCAILPITTPQPPDDVAFGKIGAYSTEPAGRGRRLDRGASDGRRHDEGPALPRGEDRP